MKKILSVALLATSLSTMAWSPQGEKIKTPWAEKVTPENVWQSYPRPQLQRAEWQNLNGLWNYAITEMDVNKKNVKMEGEILVPFAIESSLSGVQRTFIPTNKLWYQREFTLDKSWNGKQIMLHFGAVDYDCTVWVNGREVGRHVGGNNGFTFNITKFVKRSGVQKIELSVTDPTDAESVSRGKQQLNQKGIWYTPVSGIWKTVWVEAVNKTNIERILPTADIKAEKVNIVFKTNGVKGNETIRIKVKDGEMVLRTVEQKIAQNIEIPMPNATLWTDKTPKLYDLEIELLSSGKVLDKVESYFAMRKVELTTDANGHKRITLNGNQIFQYGTLDQGWWPDGLLTPPSEEAMIWDMIQLKNMGFNSLRKHIKVEPELYYYYADSLGLMVWQDMVSGFATECNRQERIGPQAPQDWNAPEEHKKQWEKELFTMIDQLRFYPSITTWVVFNEGWGQYDTKRIVEEVMAYDDSRIINGVSGWTDRKVGEMYDVHNYPVSSMELPEHIQGRAAVLGEFGGYGLPVEGHLWNPNMRNWGYKNIDGGLDFAANYFRTMYDLEALIAQGLTAAIYTQTTDVEGEVNGLITYDRKVVKMPADMLHFMHSKLYTAESAKAAVLIADGRDNKTEKRSIIIDGKNSEEILPIKIQGPKTVRSEYTFKADKCYNNLVLWLRMHGNAKVWLNGELIFNQFTNQTRHYNQFNVSNYSEFLKAGYNTLVIELKQNDKGQKDFDYGFRAY